MISNYRLLRNGHPVAWFTHADQIETILKADPSPDWTVEFGAIDGVFLEMDLNEFGWLRFTSEAQKTLDAL